jgi:hypothetical protein
MVLHSRALDIMGKVCRVSGVPTVRMIPLLVLNPSASQPKA